jgi:hypothetical protein
MVVKKPGTKKDGGTPAGAVDVEVESNNEVVAIESIFGDDFASQVAGEHERHRFALTIKPCPAEADAANLAVVRLLVGLPVNYPLHPPRIALEPVQGLTEPVFAELANLLRARVAEHWG